MKICKKCNKIFDDSNAFCPECGEKLETLDQTNNNNNVINNLSEYLKAKSDAFDNNENVLIRWLPSILSVLGLIFTLKGNYILGIAVAIAGVLYGWFSQNQQNKIIATVVGIITIILCIA
ncbi:MAG: hypothetical protein ACI4DX_04965 [Oliverpabstia sp.]